MLTQKRLKELLRYSPETGLFYWLVDRFPRHAGDVAGHHGRYNYVRISIDDRSYRAHRLAFMWMLGRWPTQFVDHIDMNKKNNKWSNLREASKSQNQANISMIKANTSGLKGVSRYRAGDSYGKPWQAGICKDGKRKSLGHFATKEEAHAAYRDAAEKAFGKFARS
jgi:hypothetical protein